MTPSAIELRILDVTGSVAFATDPADGLVAIHGPATPSFPFSIVCAGWRGLVHRGDTVRFVDGSLACAQGSAPARRVPAVAMPRARGALVRLAGLDGGGPVAREHGPGIAAALARGGDAFERLTAILGRGPGLTPGGDDLLLGICAGLDLGGGSPVRDRFRAAFARVVAASPAATTRVSSALLAEALAGRHVPAIVDLCAAAADPTRPLDGAAARLAAIGSTTGRELLSGLAIAASAVVTMERAA